MTNNKKIDFSAPDILDSDIQSMVDVIKSGWLAHGEYSKKLEDLFCEYTGANYAAPVSHCTAGLHLSCLASGFHDGDEVLVPAQTHTATAHAVELCGAKPVFIDVDPLDGNILSNTLEEKINSNTKGIIPVHMAGVPCDMNQIQSLCENYNLVLIEDCAHAVGTTFNDMHVGNFGKTGNFSFYPTKQITTGEGGIVISNDSDFIDNINKLKAFGIDTPPELRKKPGVYDVMSLGYNYRMTDFQAALGVGQMERYNKNVESRRSNAIYYSQLLKEDNRIKFSEYSKNNSYFLFQVILNESIDRNKILFDLKQKNIGVSIHYATPVPLMSYYKNKYGYRETDFPNAVFYGNQSISLPVHPKLKQSEIEYVCSVLLEALEN